MTTPKLIPADIQPGPCAACGLRNYALSFGGPTICPACDCGDSGPSRMNAQRQRIAALERALESIRSEIDGMADADIDGPNVFMRIDTLIDDALSHR